MAKKAKGNREKPQVIPDAKESRNDHTLQTTYLGMKDCSSTCLPLLGKPANHRTPNQPSTNHMATNGRDLGVESEASKEVWEYPFSLPNVLHLQP